MIRRKVQNRAHLRTETGDRLQLKAAHLRHGDRLVRHLIRSHRIGISYVAHHEHLFLVRPHDLAQKSRGGRLPVCPGDGKDVTLPILIGKLHLPGDRNPLLPHRCHNRKVKRHSRTKDCQVKHVQKLRRKISDHNLRLRAFTQLSFHIFFFQLIIAIVQNNLRPMFFQKLRRADAAYSRAKHKHPFP